jgi:hypothetical protein|tara:strand:+ start:297 stop:917 length:621 start_codon:yes stop_codon:yes gene_type:complete
MATFKKDMNKLTYKEIEDKPGRLAGQIVLNQLYDNDFHMWFIGNTEGNQLYTVTLSNEEKAIVGFIDESIASNYINRASIITLINKSFGPKVVLVNLSLYKIHEIMKNNFMVASVEITSNTLTHQLTKHPIQTVIINPNDHDFFVPLNIPYIVKKYTENIEVGDLNIEDHKDEKELSLYEIDKESKRYVFCPEGPAEYGPEFGRDQ